MSDSGMVIIDSKVESKTALAAALPSASKSAPNIITNVAAGIEASVIIFSLIADKSTNKWHSLNKHQPSSGDIISFMAQLIYAA
jgi:hypothetical protein